MISSAYGEKVYEYRGLLADFNAVKDDPTFNKKVGNGSIFLVFGESTTTVYIFDEEHQEWKVLN